MLKKAAQALRDNALQTTYVPRESCPDSDYQSHGDCASCGFKCEKNINPHVVPAPETTFPLPQIIVAIAGFVAGCLLSQVFLKLF